MGNLSDAVLAGTLPDHMAWVASVQLAASRPARLTASIGLVDSVDSDTRTLSGLGLPIGEVGHTSIGPVTVASDCELVWPRLLSDVKLVDEHREPPQPIGYLSAQRRVEAGWRMAFTVGRTPDGDRALLLAAERLREGFSVELDDLRFSAGGELIGATVVRVAHVTTPAFASARHDGMAASRNTPPERNTPMTEEQRARLAELLANTARTDADNTELAELAAARLLELVANTTRTDAETTELAQLLDVIADTTDTAEEPEPEAEAAASDQGTGQLAASRRQSARVPGSLASGGSRRRSVRPPQLRELYAAQARVMSGRSRPQLEAALSDITSTANIWVAGDEYAGQLWSGLEYQRRFVGNSMPGELNSYKGTGWRWVVKPEVGDYAGDKAAVPSNAPTTEDAEWTAARLAGAHDIDRKFWDFGDEEFIAAYYQAMRESYAKKSDLKALAFQLASASAIGAAGATMFHAAATVAQAVEDATTGSQVDFFYINSADRLDLMDLTNADVPAYLEVFGVTPDKFIAAPGVAAGTVVGGTRQATRFRELNGSPIRVEAINVANGGIDGGVFGYYATELVHDGGIQSATFVAA